MSAARAAHGEVRKRVQRTRVTAWRRGVASERVDRTAAEEPMEIRVQGPGQTAESVAVTMRTPGDDFDLAVGFLATEGLLRSPDEVETVAYCRDGEGTQEFNIVTVTLRRRWEPGVVQRNLFATSSCGICGKATLDAVEVRCERVAPGPSVTPAALLSLPERMREAQRVFEETGGLHATALFDAGAELVTLREDVGRHNAFDKVVGRALLAGDLPLSGHVAMVSGRASFEIVQKAAAAGVPVVCAVSAPSSLAVDAGERFGVTVVGFLRSEGFNVYTHPERVELGGERGG